MLYIKLIPLFSQQTFGAHLFSSLIEASHSKEEAAPHTCKPCLPNSNLSNLSSILVFSPKVVKCLGHSLAIKSQLPQFLNKGRFQKFEENSTYRKHLILSFTPVGTLSKSQEGLLVVVPNCGTHYWRCCRPRETGWLDDILLGQLNKSQVPKGMPETLS